MLLIVWLVIGAFAGAGDLYFLAQAQAPDGRFRNRLGYDRCWRDDPGTHDCWGRALWGLGTAAARGPNNSGSTPPQARGIRLRLITQADRHDGRTGLTRLMRRLAGGHEPAEAL